MIAVTLEMFRDRDAQDPFSFGEQDTTAPQHYNLRSPLGVVERHTLDWPKLLPLLRGKDDAEGRQRVGGLLHEFLRGEIWSEVEQRIAQAEGPVHLMVRSNASELYLLPWELCTLGASGQALLERDDLLVGFAWPGVTPQPRDARLRAEGGGLVFAWSDAGGVVPHAQHADALLAAGATVQTLPDVALSELSACLEARSLAGDPVRALHLLAHGHLNRLILRGREGHEDVVDSVRLRAALAPYAGSLRMVALMACHSGGAPVDGVLQGLAMELHRTGVEVVICSRGPLSVDGSVAFTRGFYQALIGTPASVEQAWMRTAPRLTRQGFGQDGASLRLLAHAQEDGDTRVFTSRPYRGLLHFDREHRPFFMAREDETARLVARVQQAERGELPPWQLVVGRSGCGKSSLLRAGLVSGLGSDWMVEHVETGEPDGGLASLCKSLAARGAEPDASPSLDLCEIGLRLRRQGCARSLLILCDPLDPVVMAATPLPSALWALSTRVDRVVVVAGLREDLIEHASELVFGEDAPTLRTLVSNDDITFRLDSVAPSRFREIIERPARLAGLRLEAGLVEELLDEVGELESALPLLQFCLDELWKGRRDDTLTLARYHELGRFHGALARTVEGVLEGMDAARREQGRRLLVRLVRPGDEGTPSTARTVALDAVRPHDPGAAEAFDASVDALVGRWMVVVATVDGHRRARLAHEALISGWPALQRWVQEERELLGSLERLREGAVFWERDEGPLLSGDALAAGLDLRDQVPHELDALSWSFLRESERADRRRRDEERVAELEARAADARRRERVVAAVVLILIVSGVVLRELSSRADEAARSAFSLRLELARDMTGSGLVRRGLQALLQTSNTDMGWWDDGHRRRLAGRLAEGVYSGACWRPGAEAGRVVKEVAVCVAEDGRPRVALVAEDGEIVLDGSTIRTGAEDATRLALSPDCERLAVVFEPPHPETAAVRLWSATGGMGEPHGVQARPVTLGHLSSGVFVVDGAKISRSSSDGRAWQQVHDWQGVHAIKIFEPIAGCVVAVGRSGPNSARELAVKPVDGEGCGPLREARAPLSEPADPLAVLPLAAPHEAVVLLADGRTFKWTEQGVASSGSLSARPTAIHGQTGDSLVELDGGVLVRPGEDGEQPLRRVVPPSVKGVAVRGDELVAVGRRGQGLRPCGAPRDESRGLAPPTGLLARGGTSALVSVGDVGVPWSAPDWVERVEGAAILDAGEDRVVRLTGSGPYRLVMSDPRGDEVTLCTLETQPTSLVRAASGDRIYWFSRGVAWGWCATKPGEHGTCASTNDGLASGVRVATALAAGGGAEVILATGSGDLVLVDRDMGPHAIEGRPGVVGLAEDGHGRIWGASEDGSVWWLDGIVSNSPDRTRSGGVVASLRERPSTLTISPRGDALLIGDEAGWVHVFAIPEDLGQAGILTEDAALEIHSGAVRAIAIGEETRCVFSVSEEGEVSRWVWAPDDLAYWRTQARCALGDLPEEACPPPGARCQPPAAD